MAAFLFLKHPSCINLVGEKMVTCKHCNNACIKYGKQPNQQQRYKCKNCGKTQQGNYRRLAYSYVEINNRIAGMVKEGCGIRSISRLPGVSTNTIIKRIKKVALTFAKPMIVKKQDAVEVDELRTYVGNKRNEYWVAYALNRQTGKVIDFITGKRTKGTLKVLTDTLLLAQVKRIYTDNLSTYRRLIPKSIHERGSRLTNHIERNNLNLRTHLKRLSRRTICYSRSAAMLNACLRIYFWYKEA
jgi:IS1 family transposase/transposase-like protein